MGVTMNRLGLLFMTAILAIGCGRQESPPGGGPGQPGVESKTLPEARQGFTTKLTRQVAQKTPVPEPPKQLFQVVRYDSPAGKMAAYLTQPPKDGKKHPAIIWIFGGFGNDIGDTAWKEGPARNDQSASAYRKAGIVTMYPSLRGGNDNPGFQEGFFGEVDDVLAAIDYLAKQEFVDPNRIYLGGHSTGGTLVLLAAASTDRFRAVFSFGPADDVRSYGGYGEDPWPFDVSNAREFELRAPGRWLHSIKSPTFVLEGTRDGNLDALQAMQRASKNPLIRFHPVNGADHFSILRPVNALVAGKILADTGATTNIAFTEVELSNPNRK